MTYTLGLTTPVFLHIRDVECLVVSDPRLLHKPLSSVLTTLSLVLYLVCSDVEGRSIKRDVSSVGPKVKATGYVLRAPESIFNNICIC